MQCAPGLNWLVMLLLLLFPLWASTAGGPDGKSQTTVAVSGPNLFLLGTFDAYTADTVIRELLRNPQIERIVLTANGGSVNDQDTLRLGRYIRSKGIDTHLIADGVATSGGVSLLLAGVQRSAGEGAFLGVHAWAQCSRNQDGQQCIPATEFPEDHSAHDLHRDYTAEMLEDDAFYWFAIDSAAHNGIHWLSQEELDDFQVLNSTFEDRLSIPFPEAFWEEYARTCHNCPQP